VQRPWARNMPGLSKEQPGCGGEVAAQLHPAVCPSEQQAALGRVVSELGLLVPLGALTLPWDQLLTPQAGELRK
jgi:hypothetical protein